MKKCLIIDDDPIAIEIISKVATDFDEIEIIESFDSAIDAIKYVNNNNEDIDVLFLDVHMPNFTGFDLIQTLKNPPQIILITADKNFALEAFEYDCIVDYLVKPVTKDRFAKALKKLENTETPKKIAKIKVTEESNNDLYVNIDRRLVKINVPDIYLVEAKGDYIKIKTEAKNYIVHSTLKKIEDKLPNKTFLKVHRSYIINFTKIIDIEDNSILIKQDIIPVSRANKPELLKRLNLL